MAWSSLVWPGLAWPGLAWPGLVWPGLVWSGLPLEGSDLRGLWGSGTSNLGVELQPADPQVHPREALVGSDGVDLDELVLSYA